MFFSSLFSFSLIVKQNCSNYGIIKIHPFSPNSSSMPEKAGILSWDGASVKSSVSSSISFR